MYWHSATRCGGGCMAVNLDGIYCFPWPDTGAIQHYQYYDCAGNAHTSIAMPIEKLEEFIAASEGAETPPMALSVADGAELAWLIGGVWAIGWVTKQMARTLWRTTGKIDES